MRSAFIETLCELAAGNPDIWLLTADLGYSVLERFREWFPDRFVNVGVAEQNMTGIAAGLALSGKTVITYSIANFPTLRCLEQIRNDLCYHHANVKIVAVGGGLVYGTQGYTHYGIEDLAIMRALPNMVVLAPGDPWEAMMATQAMVAWDGPCYLRLGKAREANVHTSRPDFQIGKTITIREGRDVTIIATGSILKTVIDAADLLLQQGIAVKVLSMHTLKPKDEAGVLAAARDSLVLLTVEEHNLNGGLGSAVAEILSESGISLPYFRRLGIKDEYLRVVGSQEYLKRCFGISRDDIVRTVQEACEKVNLKIKT